MRRSVRRVPPVLAPVLVVLAILGYVVGAGGGSESGNATPPLMRASAGEGVQVEYPASWEAGGSSVTLPGIGLADPLRLAPRAQPSGAGLVAGRLTSLGQPLPVAALSDLEDEPRVEILELTGVQTYRYRDVHLRGFHDLLTFYLVPTAAGGGDLLACYAEPGHTSQLQDCEAIAQTLTIVAGASQQLRPSATYEHQLNTIIERLQRRREKLRGQLSKAVEPALAKELSLTLAAVFSAAAADLAALEPPSVAGPTQAALSRAMVTAAGAYRGLAAATVSEAAYAQAGGPVKTAESEVNLALEGFAMLGYGHS